MKWKTGAALMVVVLLVALIPAFFSAATGGGISIFSPRPDQHELILQVDNASAVLDGTTVTIDDGAGNALPPYIDEGGNLLLPLRFLVESLGATLEWQPDGSFLVTLNEQEMTLQEGQNSVVGLDGTQRTMPVAPTRVGGSFFVPARAVVEAVGGYVTYYPPVEGGYVIVHIGLQQEPDEKQLADCVAQAQEKLGRSVAQYMTDCLVLRVDSDSVLMNGEQVKLEERVHPITQDGVMYMQTSGLPQLSSAVTADENGQIQINGKAITAETITVEEESYTKLSDFAAALGKEYAETAQGVAILTSYPLAAYPSQLSAIEARGLELPGKSNIPEAEHYIAFTFDDGPTGGTEGVTAQLLNGLQERGAHATFFMCGYRIKDFHTQMDRLLAEGHELGNHTMDHPGLLSRYSADYVREQVSSNSDLIESYTGEKPTVMRPVGGDYNDMVKSVMKDLGLPIINWSLDTEDWKKENRDEDIIYNKIVKKARDGDIVLMHDLRECTVNGALRAIDTLKEEGFAFVTVSELAEIKGVTLEPGVLYTDFRDSTVAKLNGTAD